MSQFSNPLDLGNPLEQDKLNPLAEQQPDTVEAKPPVANVEVTNSKAREESQPLWDTVDVLAGIPRGTIDFAKGVYNAADWITQDLLPDWDTNPMGESKSTAGGLLAGLVEFSWGFVPGLGGAKVLGALGKAGKLGKVGKAVGWMAQITKEEKLASPFLSLGRRMGQDAVVGAGVSFILATPGQQRLSNLATQFDSPLLNNDITKYLASGEGETELEARFKSALESLPLGLAVDGGMQVIGKLVKGMMGGVKAARGGQVEGNKVLAAGGTEEAATKVATEEEMRLGLLHAEEIRDGKTTLDELTGKGKGLENNKISDQLVSNGKPLNNATEYIHPASGKIDFNSQEVIQKAQNILKTLFVHGPAKTAEASIKAADNAKEMWLKAVNTVENNPSLIRTAERDPFSDNDAFYEAVQVEFNDLTIQSQKNNPDAIVFKKGATDSLTKTVRANGQFKDAAKIGEIFDFVKDKAVSLTEFASGNKVINNPDELAQISPHLVDAALDSFTAQGGRMRHQGFLNGGSTHETITDAVANATELGLSKTQVLLSKWLLKAAGDQLKEAKLQFSAADGSGVLGSYSPRNHNINMRGSPVTYAQGIGSPRTASTQFSTVLHETIHQLTVRKIDEAFIKLGQKDFLTFSTQDANGKIFGSYTAANMKADDEIFKLIPKVAKKNPEVANMLLLYKKFVEDVTPASRGSREQGYGATSLYEFISEGMTNHHFQQVLMKVQTPQNSNLWTKFVSAVNGLIQGKASQEFEAFKKSLYEGISDPTTELPMLTDGETGAVRKAGSPLAKKAKAADSIEDSVLESFLNENARLIEQPSTKLDSSTYDYLAFNGWTAMKKDPTVHNNMNSSGGIDDSLAPRNDTPKQPAPIPNIEQPDWKPLSEKVVTLLNEARAKGGLTNEGIDMLLSHVQEATGENLENLQHGFDKGTRTPEFLLVIADAILQNKDAVAASVHKMSNKETAERAALLLDAMNAVGGLNSEQEARIAATITQFHGPMFEQGMAVISALVGNKGMLLVDIIGQGDQSAVDKVLSSFMVLQTARKSGNSVAGRVLQNAKMLWQESLAYKIKSMSPIQIQQNLKSIEKLAEIAEIDTQTFFKIMNGGFVNAGGTGQLTWLFKNSILSGPSTSAVNILSGVLSMIYMPAERAFGHATLALAGKSTMSAAARELAVYRGYLTAFSQVWNDASTAPCWRNIKASWEQEGNAVTMGSNSSPMGEFVPRRPIASDNPAINKVTSKIGLPTTRWDPATNTNQTTVFGTALDWFGKLAGTPTRLMGTIDETLSIVTAQAEGREIIIDSADAVTKANPKMLAAYVDTKMKEVFDDVGALFSEDAVRSRLMREAKAAGHKPGEASWRLYVQNQMARQWHAPQGLDRENNILLQKIAEKVRRRVEESTFKRDYDTIIEGNTIGPAAIGNLGKAASNLVQQVPALGMIIPFVKTPTNLAAWALERSPSAAGRMLYKQWQNPELRGEVMGRLCAGTLMYGTMMTLAMSGKLTGRGPNDPNVRKALVDSGWQPNSFKIGETWVQYARMDPLATIFGMAADMVEIASHKYTDQDFVTVTDAIAKVSIGTIANNLVNKTYLAGLKGTLDAITSWETKGDAFVKQYAGSFVPNIIAQSNLVMNDDLAAPQGALDAIRSRIPGLARTVDRRRNALGEPMENNMEPWNLAMPTVTTKTSNDPVRRELANLLVGFAPPAPQLDGGINLTQYKNGSGQSAYDRYQQLTSQVEVGGRNLHDRLAQLIGSPVYQNMPDTSVDGVETSRVGMLRSEISRYRRHALTQLGQEFPDIQQRKNDVMDIRNQMKRGN